MTIDFSELTQWKIDAEQYQAQVKPVLQRRVHAAAIELKAMIKLRMPVDTGGARDSWGAGGLSAASIFRGFIAGIYRFADQGLTHIQGSTHETNNYIARLNEGSSRQAPAGFIDAEVARQDRILGAEILNDMMKVLK